MPGMKCSVCKAQIGETFLNKIRGTFVKDAQGKKFPVCFECQQKLPSKEEILEKL